MATTALWLAGFVALEHVGFLILEMFLWETPTGLRIFKLQPDIARASRALAANQGLYNGFLAAGLACGLLAGDPKVSFALLAFALSCVIIAGIFGAVTVSGRIAVIQALPAALALAALVAGR